MNRSALLTGRTYFVRTFGCQMNLHDSERVAGVLDDCGCIAVATPEEADIVVFMTCSVREKADTHLYGQASGIVSLAPPPSGHRILAIGGCVAQRDGAELRRTIPGVNVVFGTGAIASLPILLEAALSDTSDEIMVDTADVSRDATFDLPQHREFGWHAWVPIMSGCDNFCSYCIVPYVRGRERSRSFERVVAECEKLVADGAREICLLGQNVNSYGRDLYGSPRFAELFRAVGATGIERLRFTSSNPKDMTDDVISALAETPAAMPHLHLAVQSGSTRILAAMNRKYSRDDYLALVERLYAAIPGLAISTDIIVGFPGETEEDFSDTLSLVERVRFASAFTFIYSPRPGTPAAKMADDTPRELIQQRFERLGALVVDLAYEHNQRYLHTIRPVLVEGPSKRDPSVLVGHSPENVTVHFPAPRDDAHTLIGDIVDVRIEQARTWYLSGVAIRPSF